MNMKRFDYVASGCSYFNLTSKAFSDPEDTTAKDIFNRVASRINNSDSHYFSLLYNAHTEKNHADKFRANHTSDSVRKIYADSGGLQVVTQGMQITEEFKHKVYKNQSKYADLGMSFDEIPVSLLTEKSIRADYDNRYFDQTKFHQAAKDSGINLKKQIDVFLEDKSQCKPVFIVQGSDLQTYQQWVEIAFNELNDEEIKHSGGSAMGAAALGGGTLEDIKRAFYYSQLSDLMPKNQMHLLGVGSAKRLLPNILMMKAGLYNEDTIVSYDSTTHSSCWAFGRYSAEGQKFVNVTRDQTIPEYDIIYEDIKRNIGDDFFLTNDEFRHFINSNLTNGGEPQKTLNAQQMWVMSSIINFIKDVDRGVADPDFLIEKCFMPKEQGVLRNLLTIRDVKDYNEWEGFAKPYLMSKAYPDHKPITLEGFF